MLTQASDYLYYTPIAAGVHGQPMPVRTGAAKSVVKYEDIVYLAEMAAERWIWCTADTYPYHDMGEGVFTTPLTNPDSLVLKRADLRRIQNVARRIATHFYPGDQIGTFADNGNGVPANWNDGVSPNSPVVGETAYNAWLATAALPSYTDADAGSMESMTPYEDLFSYFDSIKRYVFYDDGLSLSGILMKDADISESTGVVDGVRVSQVGNATITEPDGSSYEITNALSPYYMVDYHRKTGSATEFVTDRSSCAAESGYKLYIHKVFAFNRLAGAFTMQSPTLYIKFLGRVEVRHYGGQGSDYDSGHTIPVLVKLGSPASGSLVYSGLVNLPVYYPMSKSTITGPMTQRAYFALVSWAEDNVPDFSLSGSNRAIVTLWLEGVYLDTGVITHCSNLQA